VVAVAVDIEQAVVDKAAVAVVDIVAQVVVRTTTTTAVMDTSAAAMDTRAPAAMDTRAPAVERAIATGHTEARTGGRLSTRILEVVVLSQHLFFLLFSFAWWAFGCSSAFGYRAVDLVRWQDLKLFLWRQISRMKTAADR
jgi:hypothetical protein